MCVYVCVCVCVCHCVKWCMCVGWLCEWCCEAAVSDGVLGWTVARRVSLGYGIVGLPTGRLWSHVRAVY